MPSDVPALKSLSRQDVQALLEGPDVKVLETSTSRNVYAVRYEGQTCALKLSMRLSVTFRTELAMLQRIAGAVGAPVPLAYCSERPALLTTCAKDTLTDYLEQRASSAGLSLLQVLYLALRVTKRLQQLHRAGFVHCNLASNKVTLRVAGKRKVASVHLSDLGLSARIGERRAPRAINAKTWQCKCVGNGAPLSPACDLPGLASILQKLFRGRADVPRRVAALAKLCAHPRHRKRPDLKEVRRCLEEACVSLLPVEERQPLAEAAPLQKAKRPREDHVD